MPRYLVSFERKAVQIRRIMLDAPTEAAAVQAAAIFVEEGLGLVMDVSDETYRDEESVWEHLDTEPSHK